MKTLIELWDERPIENVLAAEMFRPEEVVYVCPPEKAEDREWRQTMEAYFRARRVPVRTSFVPVSLLDAGKIRRALRDILREHPDAAIDISGGTDATLFAAGAAAGRTPVFTYSHKRNTFFEIQHAPFARSLPCTVRLDAASCFLMAGGVLLPGREDNRALRERLPDIDAAWDVYRRFRSEWPRQVKYFQRISSAADPALRAEGQRTEKADNSRVTVSEDLLRALAAAGLIRELTLGEEAVSFRFADDLTRFWLRDVGAILELHVFAACLRAGCFDDTVLSAVVKWRGAEGKRDAVTNEIDVMAVRGVQPVFISCKTCEIKTEALNELAILRDRFGGEDSRAMIVTSAGRTRAASAMRKRAAALGIEVVDWGDLEAGRLERILQEPEGKR